MEENLNKLITTLTELVEELREQKTGDVVEQNRSDNAFMDPLAIKKKEQEEQAKINAEEASKKQKEDSRKQPPAPRKIRADIIPVSIVNIDRKVLQSLAKIMPSAPIMKQKKQDQQSGDFDWKTLLMGGALGLIIAPVVALFSFFKELGKQKWFIKLKDFLKTKFWKPLSNFFSRISGWFTTLKTKLEPVTKTIRELLKKTGKMFRPIESIMTGIKSRIEPIINSIKKFLVPIFGDGKAKQSIFTRLSNKFLKNPAFKAVMDISKGIGKLLGKLFLPITVIWGIVETISGFMKGYEKGGVAQGVSTAFQSLFDFLIGDIVRFLTSIPAKILEWVGLPVTAQALTKSVDGLLASVNKQIDNVVSFITGIFTLDIELMKKSFLELLDGAVDFVAYASSLVIDPVVTFFGEVFKFGNPDVPFSFKEAIVDPVWKNVKTWFTTLISFGETTDGKWNLSVFVTEIEAKIVKFFTDIFSWGVTSKIDENGNRVEEFNLGTFVGTSLSKAKEWIVGLFDWVDPGIVFSLKDEVMKTWESVKSWFTGLLRWAESDTNETGVEDGLIVTAVKGAITNVKLWLDKLFSFDDTTSTVISAFNVLTWFPNLVVQSLGNVSAWFARLFGFNEGSDQIKEWTTKFSIGDLIVNAVKKAWKWLESRFPDTTKYITKQWNNLTGGISDLGSYIWNEIKDVWRWFEGLWANPKAAVEKSWNNLTKNLKLVSDFIWTGIDGVWSWVKDKWSGIKEAAAIGWAKVASGVTSVGDWIWAGIDDVWSWVKDKWSGIKEAAAIGWTRVASGVTSVGDWIWTGIDGVWSWVKDTWDSIKQTAVEGWARVASGVINVGDWIWSGIDGVWSWVKEKWDSLKQATVDGWARVASGVTSVGDWIWGKINGVWSWVQDLWLDPKQKLTEMWATVAAGVTSVGDWLWTQVSGAWKWFTDMFPDLGMKIETAWAALTNNVTNVGEYVGNKVTSAWKWFTDVWDNIDIKSHLPDWVKDPGGWMAQKLEPVWKFFDRLFDMERHINSVRDMVTSKAPKIADFLGIESGKARQERLDKAAVRQAKEFAGSSAGAQMFDKTTVQGIAGGLKWANLTDSSAKMMEVEKRSRDLINKTLGTDYLNADMDRIKSIGETLSRSKRESDKLLYKTLQTYMGDVERAKREESARVKKLSSNLQVNLDRYDKGLSPIETKTESQIKTKTESQIKKVVPASQTSVLPRTLEENKQLLDALQRFPQPTQQSTPEQWKSFDINTISPVKDPRQLYNQSIQNNQAQQINDKQAKVNDELNLKFDKMVELMSENVETQKQALDTIKEQGTVNKQGDTVVNNGGNNTNVVNVTRDSDIITHRNKVIGRLMN